MVLKWVVGLGRRCPKFIVGFTIYRFHNIDVTVAPTTLKEFYAALKTVLKARGPKEEEQLWQLCLSPKHLRKAYNSERFKSIDRCPQLFLTFEVSILLGGAIL